MSADRPITAPITPLPQRDASNALQIWEILQHLRQPVKRNAAGKMVHMVDADEQDFVMRLGKRGGVIVERA